MDDDLDFSKMEDDLKFFKNGRQPKLFQKWKPKLILGLAKHSKIFHTEWVYMCEHHRYLLDLN
jgi:hypothetical protein